MDAIEPVLEQAPVVFPIHPRTRQTFDRHGLGPRLADRKRLHFTDPVGYLEFLCLMDHSWLVLTDSGGIQGWAAR